MKPSEINAILHAVDAARIESGKLQRYDLMKDGRCVGVTYDVPGKTREQIMEKIYGPDDASRPQWERWPLGLNVVRMPS